MSVAVFCRLHGAATTKSGAARAIIEAVKRIVFMNVLLWTVVFKGKEGLLEKSVVGEAGLKSGPVRGYQAPREEKRKGR